MIKTNQDAGCCHFIYYHNECDIHGTIFNSHITHLKSDFSLLIYFFFFNGTEKGQQSSRIIMLIITFVIILDFGKMSC